MKNELWDRNCYLTFGLGSLLLLTIGMLYRKDILQPVTAVNLVLAVSNHFRSDAEVGKNPSELSRGDGLSVIPLGPWPVFHPSELSNHVPAWQPLGLSLAEDLSHISEKVKCHAVRR